MTDEQWDGLTMLMEDCWSGELDNRRAKSYRVFLNRFDPEEVSAALFKLAEDGKPFLPAVPEIVKAVRDAQEVPVPPWPEVWTALQMAMKKQTPEDSDAYLIGVHELIAKFMQVRGWQELRLTPFFDPEFGHFRVAELERQWHEFVRVAGERARTGQALEAMGRRSSLTKFDPVAALGLKPPGEVVDLGPEAAKQIGPG